MMKLAVLALLFTLLLTQSVMGNETCILYSIYDQAKGTWTDEHDCNQQILSKKYSSGSLFKIFLVSAGYHYQKIQPNQFKQIQTYMAESNNDYFVELVKSITHEKLILYFNQHLNNYLKRKVSSRNFPSPFSFLHGGDLKFKPQEIMEWFKELYLSKKEDFSFAKRTLFRKEASLEFYGKSGTWDGAAWFCGFTPEGIVICSLTEYPKPHWQKAKELSYQNFINQLEKIKIP
ncbi:MAG: hypothetical protein NZ853_06185 [Leptospiraceae bacterium]|nr:hypothetical protein [Leptospiraceae bacterium]MDW7976460.1 hypothetical protein [Leptospiraceae bacterium]